MESPGYPYRRNPERFLKRDRALVAILYLLALRVNEALRIRRVQFSLAQDKRIRKTRVKVTGIRLSKSRKKGKTRKHEYREEAWLPLRGPRAKFTKLVLDWFLVEPKEEYMWLMDRRTAWVRTVAFIGVPNHWLRAYGENYLYDEWKHDILAVADYVKVDPRTLGEYIRRGYQKYKPA